VFGIELPDALDAREVALRLAARPGLCWLDGEPSHASGRYAFVAADPVERVRAGWPQRDVLERLAQLDPGPSVHDAPCALPFAPPPEAVPRSIGYIAYDASLTDPRALGSVPEALEAQRGKTRLARREGTPVLDFARYDALAAFDLVAQRGFVLGDDRAACERLVAKLEQPALVLPETRVGAIELGSAEAHAQAITRALEHIAAGDLYQVNLARPLIASFSGAPLALFLALRAASPVPLGFYYDDGERVIAARTMECFLRWDRARRALHSRPIKGTIARGGDDAVLASTLERDEKERAEHAMIVDLMRNDLSRVAELGSVRVDAPFSIEPFARLLHMVSTVACTTRPEVTLHDVLKATFPPGSVTGAPKLAAIALIEALEQAPRDVYTGALGFIDRTGGCSLAVAIRTAIVERDQLRYFAGGGIVEASQVERELAETELKAAVLHDAQRGLLEP
jgi:anthranilate/para-aminobenzoate synthase component I